MAGGGRTGDRGGAGRWTEDAGPAASWGELRLTFVGGVGMWEMSAEQVSVMVVDCDVGGVGLELTSCLLLDFSEFFALRSLW